MNMHHHMFDLVQGVTKVCPPFLQLIQFTPLFYDKLKINLQSFLELYQNYTQNSKGAQTFVTLCTTIESDVNW